MNNIFSSSVAQVGASPFSTIGMSSTPGGGAATKFQSLLESRGKAEQPACKMSSASAAATPADSSSSGTDDSGSTISANDFLTLLVTEMQNQDPTAQTDPNEYINQLVQINSLEQLISINQNLSDVLGAAGSQSAGSVASGIAPDSAVPASSIPTAASTRVQSPGPVQSGTITYGNSAAPARAGSHSSTHGNLSLPKPTPASQTVAHALDGHARAVRTGHAIRDIPTH